MENDWAAGIPDREYYSIDDYYIPEHLLFAPWKGYAELSDHLTASTNAPTPKYYFLFKGCVQGLAAGDGEVWELGVYRGSSASFLASIAGKRGRTVRLFDTFEGMPETDPELDQFHQAGDFSDTNLDSVKAAVLPINPAVEFHPGFIPDTFVGLENACIAFAHVDLDIYHPIKASCEFIFPRMLVGGVLIFDDYGWASCPGARQAVDEFFRDRPEEVFSLPSGQAMVVKIAPG